MRMWNVDVKGLCRQHLLGEHLEMHMFVGCILKGRSLKGYVNSGLVERHTIKIRHEMLAEEMSRRGYCHKSPLPDYSLVVTGNVDSSNNLLELHRRCIHCRKRHYRIKEEIVK